MPSPFDNIQFAQYNRQYVPQPIDEFANTVGILNQRYDEGAEMNDALETALASIRVDPENQQHIQNRAAIINDNLRELINTGRFEHGRRLIKSQFKELSNDQAVRSSLEHYNARQNTKANLRDKYEKGYYNKELYDDEIEQFNNYQGIGEKDDLGFYKAYEHKEGAKYFDIDKYADELLNKYQGGDTSTINTSTLNYSDNGNISSEQAKMLGMPSSETTVSKKYTDGTEAQAIVQAGILSNPDAMAYIDRLVDIRQRKGIDTNRDKIIQEYTDRTLAKYSGFDKITTEQERAINMQEVNKALYGDFKGVNFVETTPLPALSTEQSIDENFGNWGTRFGSNLLGAVTSIFSELPKGFTVTTGGDYPNLGVIVQSWQDLATYRKEKLNQMPIEARGKVTELIYTYGDDNDRRALDNVNGDIDKLSPANLSRAISTVRKNNNGDELKTTNYQHTPIGVVNHMIGNRFPEGTKLGQIGNTNPLITSGSILVYGKSGTKPKHYNNWNDFKSDIGKGVLDMPIQEVQEFALSQDLASVTGDTNLDFSLSMQVGDYTIAFGVGNTSNPSEYFNTKKGYTREYRHIKQRARPDKTVEAQMAERKPIGTIPNLFKYDKNANKDNREEYEVFAQKIVGDVSTIRWALRNPNTGSVTGIYNTFEEALYEISEKDKKFNELINNPNISYTTFDDMIRRDEALYK